MISWLSGSLAAGLLLAAVPLIIHLISRRRARDVEFPALALVLRSKKRTARTVRLQKLILLLLRTLLVTLFCLAVMQPLWQRSELNAGPTFRNVALLVDVSASMSATDGGETALDAAKRKLLSRLSDIGEDTPLSLWRCGQQPRVLVPTGFDRPAIRRAVDALTPTTEHGTLAPCIAAAAAAAPPGSGDAPAPAAAVVFSDLARHAVGDASPAESKGALTVEFVAAHEDVPLNIGWGEVKIAPLFDGGQRVEFDLVGSLGPDGSADVELLRHGARAARAQVFVSGARSAGRLSATAFDDDDDDDDDDDTHGGDGDAPAANGDSLTLVADVEDAISWDNTLTFPVAMRETVRVLILDGAPAQIAHRDEAFYLEAALNKQRSDRVRISTIVRAPEQVSPGDLADVRAVVLANVARLDDRWVRALNEYVQAGGGLLITSGDKMDTAWMNQALGDLLPGTLRGQKVQGSFDSASGQTLGLTRPLSEHPLFDTLRDDANHALFGLTRVRTATTMLLESDTQRPKTTLLSFTDGSPALTERQAGRGRVLLWLTSADRDWSDICIRPGFLPLFQELVAYAAGVQRAPQDRFSRLHTARVQRWPDGIETVIVTAPDGQTTNIDAASAAAADDGTRTFAFTPEQIGVYQLAGIRSGEQVPSPLTAMRFSARVDPNESDLVRAAPEALRSALPAGASETERRDDGKTPLWPFALVLVPVIFLAESALGLAGRAKRRRPR